MVVYKCKIQQKFLQYDTRYHVESIGIKMLNDLTFV